MSKENKSTPLSGTMLEGVSVVASGQGVTSRGTSQSRFWNIEMLPGNAYAPAKENISLHFGKAAALPGGIDAFAIQRRTVFQRQQNEAFAYDADGNLTSDGLWSYAYDAENRLISMETLPELRPALATVSGEPQPCRLEFIYDHLGRRAGKKTYKWENDGWAPAEHLKFIYDGWNLIAEYEADPSPSTLSLNLKRSFFWGLDGTGSPTATAGIGALLMIQDRDNAYFPAFDGSGNVAGLLDKNGTSAAKYEYDPYGALTRIEGDYGHENPFRWSTKYTDNETGLVYYGYRYYSSRTGRFINRDPIGEQGGLNLYEFVHNNAVNRVDVLGLWWDEKEPDPPKPDDTKDSDEQKRKDTEGQGNNSNSDIVEMEKFTVYASRSFGHSLAWGGLSLGRISVNLNIKIAPNFIKIPCSTIAKGLLSSIKNKLATREIGANRASDSDRKQLYNYFNDLIQNGGDLGIALAIGWAGAGSRSIDWAQGFAGGGMTPEGNPRLALMPGEKFFSNSQSKDLPKNPAIVVGHELGHAVIGINGARTPSRYKVVDPKNNSFDLGMEIANTAFVENLLRYGFGESLRKEYDYGAGSQNIVEALKDTSMKSYYDSMQNKVSDYMDKIKKRFNCE